MWTAETASTFDRTVGTNYSQEGLLLPSRPNEMFGITRKTFFIDEVGFDVLTVEAIKRTSDITPCSPVKVNRRFGRIYRLYFQRLRVS
jgi:hypothetical protein